jgi:hypothetical protein
MLSFSPHVNVYLGFHLEEYMKQFFQLRKNILVVVTTACLIIPMILVSCDLIDNQQNRTGSLAFILSSNMNARTLVPGISLDAATYDLEGFGPEDASFSVSNISETSYVRYDLAPGEWTVIATARNSLGDAIASASATTTIEARKTSVVTLTCAPISGTGSLLLEVSWPVDIITEPELTATVVSGTGIVLNVPFTLETGTGSGILAGIPYGYHTVSIKLKEKYGSEKIVWGRVEAALILSDHPTTGSWELSQTDLAIYQTGGIEAKLGTLIPKPLTITLVDTFSQLQLGTSRTVSVAIPESNNFVQWYLNGDPITSATESTLTFGTDLMLGTYWLDVVVGKEDSRGSTGFRFEVKEASEPVIIIGNCMWNSYAYFSWQNITTVYQPDNKNAIIDTWKVDENGNGDPRDDENRLVWNGQSNNPNGITFGCVYGLEAGQSGWDVDATVDALGNGVVTFTQQNNNGSATATYKLTPDSEDLYGQLTFQTTTTCDFYWGIHLINGVYVNNDPGEMALYDQAYVQGQTITARLSPLNQYPVEGEDYIKSSNLRAGVAAIYSTQKNWQSVFELKESSADVDLLSWVRMASQYGGWGFNRSARVEKLLTSGDQITLKSVFRTNISSQ